MKKTLRISLLITALGAVILLAACSSTEKKVETPAPAPTPVVEAKPEPSPAVLGSRAVDPSDILDQLNEKLSKVAIKGIPPYAASLSGAEMTDYAEKAVSASKAALEAIPEGYVLQISGHSNPHPNKAYRKGNSLSVKRAKFVYDYFVEKGVPKEKLTFRGVESAEYDKSLSHDDNRCVTFKIVKEK